jgi:hypothetical protein
MFSKTPLSRRLTELEHSRKIAILTRTPLWKACLQRNFHQTEISWALDIDTLMEEVAEQELLTVIIELLPVSIVEDCRKVRLTSQHCHRTRFFAVGDRKLQSWLPLIRVCGFADCCRDVGALSKLISRVRRKDETCSRDNLTIEERVLSELPWKPVRQ